MNMDIAVVSSHNLAKSAGIQTVTQTLFAKHFPIFFLDENENPALDSYDVVVMSGFDQSFIPLTERLHNEGKKIAVFWHFSTASEVDPDLGQCWQALLTMLRERRVDLFVTCKKGLDTVVKSLFEIPTFFIMNNANETEFRDLMKHGIGIYSGSSDYWVKNLRPNLYAALMTQRQVDILPYDASLREIVRQVGAEDRVIGTSERLEHEAFLRRMAQREIVSYVTFVEAAPILPLEALNNDVICLVGNNHPYFQEDRVLFDFLTVNEPDNPAEIARKIERALTCRQEILGRYGVWKIDYDARQRRNFAEFVKVLMRL